MYIPESNSNVKSLRIPLWFPRFIIFSILGLIIFSVFCVYSLNSLNTQYQLSKQDIKQLSDINDKQKSKINILQQNAVEIQKQLEENSSLLEELKKVVGVESEPEDDLEDETSSLNKMTTMASIVQNTTTTGSFYTDMSNSLDIIKTGFVSLSTIAKSQNQYINTSTNSIHSQIAYERTLPCIKPVTARITSTFGYRQNPITSRGSEFHNGIDFGAPYGTEVLATADGSVIFAGWNSGYGKMVIISHGNGLTTLYAHNSKILVKKGDKVKRGQVISKVGNTGRSTGPHLHYEIKLNGKRVNPNKYFE